MNIVWLPTAIKNRDALIDHIAAANPQAAIAQDLQIESQVDTLEIHPEIGRPGRKRGTRELVIPQTHFVAIYRVRPKLERIEILRMLHSSQQFP